MCSSGEPAPFLLREGPRGLGVVEEEEEELELQEVSRAWPLLKGPVYLETPLGSKLEEL